MKVLRCTPTIIYHQHYIGHPPLNKLNQQRVFPSKQVIWVAIVIHPLSGESILPSSEAAGRLRAVSQCLRIPQEGEIRVWWKSFEAQGTTDFSNFQSSSIRFFGNVKLLPSPRTTCVCLLQNIAGGPNLHKGTMWFKWMDPCSLHQKPVRLGLQHILTWRHPLSEALLVKLTYFNFKRSTSFEITYMNEPHPVTFYSTVNMSLFSGENWLVNFCMKQCPSIPSHAQEGRQELVLPGGGVQTWDATCQWCFPISKSLWRVGCIYSIIMYHQDGIV